MSGLDTKQVLEKSESKKENKKEIQKYIPSHLDQDRSQKEDSDGFLQKVEQNPDQAIKDLESKEQNNENVDKIPEYIKDTSGYKALVLLYSKGIIKLQGISYDSNKKELVLKLENTSKVVQFTGDEESDKLSFDETAGNAISELVGLDGGIVNNQEKIDGSLKYAIIDKKSNISGIITYINKPTTRYSSINRSACDEIISKDSKILKYLLERK